MIDLDGDILVNVDYKENCAGRENSRLSPRGARIIAFGKGLNVEGHAVVHVNYESHYLVMIDLRENDVVHVDYE